jgi:ATP-dependent helicase Lhr and Lhr-like helicase
MVFESSVGETFLLGASTWRIEEITHDRVLVSPAPGEPGKMPFWKGDGPGRPYELGRAIGRLVRELRGLPRAAAIERLVTRHDLDALAAENLLQYLEDQATATRAVPDDRTIVVERCRDELGDWRVCVLSPFGGRVLTPWALAAVARVRDEKGIDVEVMWTDDGFVVRFPETDEPPDPALVLPPAGGDRAPRRAPARVERALRGEVPRGRRAGAAAAAPPARRAGAPVAAAQARSRPAGRRRAVRLVPGAARDLPRVPARRLRHARARRCPAARRGRTPSAS